jgi:hypothetical protein
VSLRPACATQRDPVSNKTEQKTLEVSGKLALLRTGTEGCSQISGLRTFVDGGAQMNTAKSSKEG